MNTKAWILVGISIAAGAAGGYVLAANQDSRDRQGPGTWESTQASDLVKIPAFPWQALSSPLARKATLWTTADGRWSRYTVEVDKSALPDWVHAMADARLGRGPDLKYEIERYPDGGEVYEVYRKLDGREAQLSVKPDRSIYYVGTEQAADKLPEAVAAAMKTLPGAVVEHCVLKEGPTVAEYHLKATVEKAPCRIRVSKDGKLIAVQRKLPAEVEVPLKS